MDEIPGSKRCYTTTTERESDSDTIIMDKVGDRIRDRKGFRGTIKYIGKVCTSTKDPDFVWIGVQWDDEKRGKHDGSVTYREKDDGEAKTTKRYFTCAKGTSGSFVKPTKIVHAVDFLTSVRARYEEASASGSGKGGSATRSIAAEFDGDEGRTFEVTLVGVDKIQKRQKLDVIERISIEGGNVGVAGDSVEGIGKACPNIKEAHMQETLLCDWTEIAAIAAHLPKLELLNISRNPMRSFSVPASSKGLSSLRFVVLNETGSSWKDVLLLQRLAPCLEELHACGNDFESLAGIPDDGFSSLRAIDLSDNPKLTWPEIMRFRTLTKLEYLVLNNTSVSSVELDSVTTAGGRENPSSFFASLRSLSLCQGKLASWTSVDTLNRFPSLVALKCQDHPFLQRFGPRQQRQQLIARVAGIRQLNSSDVRLRERNDAEKIYIKTSIAAALASSTTDAARASDVKNADDVVGGVEILPGLREALPLAAARAKLVRSHPRLPELLKRHGIPASLRGGMDDGAKMRGMVSLVLRSMATVSISREPKKQRVPIQMKVGDLKRLCARYFKVKPDRQVLKYREADDFAVPTTLDDDDSTLAYYGMADGGSVFVHDDGDVKKKGSGGVRGA